MTVTDQISAHQSRCEHALLRLQALARAVTGTGASRQLVAAEVRDATTAVIAEADAAGRYALAATGGGRREPHAETFLCVRLARLEAAADEAVSAARDGDAPRLSREVRRFDALTSAIWTVERAVFGEESAHDQELLALAGRKAAYG